MWMSAWSLVVGGLLVAAGGAATAASGQDRLIEFDQIAISHDLCGFPLSDEQSDALRSESDAIVDDGGVQPDVAQQLYDQYAESMRRQKETGLCDPKGEWASTYQRLVGTLGKP